MAPTARPTAEHPLLILAMDHRGSLETKLYGIEGEPTPLQSAKVARDKMLVFEGLLQAMGGLPGDATPGVLTDELNAASVVSLAARTDGLDLSVPVEASGNEWFAFQYPGDWRTHAEVFGNDHVKVLIRDNPGEDPAARAEQARDLAPLSDWARENDRPFILELLVPATDDDLAGVAGDAARYDAEVRPGLTVEVVTALQDAGVEPALWKLEGYETREGAEQVVAAVRRDGRDADLIVLGRNAPQERLEHWLQVAAPVDGYVGFAIGRSIWWDALGESLRGDLDEDGVRDRVARNYLGFARTYLGARG